MSVIASALLLLHALTSLVAVLLLLMLMMMTVVVLLACHAETQRGLEVGVEGSGVHRVRDGGCRGGCMGLMLMLVLR